MHLLEPRPYPSRVMRWTAPLIAVAATLIVGSMLFLALGKDPLESFHVFFVQPLESSYGWSELLIKACPLILIAQGLALGFKARIYNIGAEGQLIVGALAGGGVAIAMEGSDASWIVPAMVVAGAIGGALWGAIPALLKTRFNAEETLTTLMLSYVANHLLSYMVNGPWRDPEGMNFPQSIMFSDSALFRILLEGSRVNTSVFITLFAIVAFWIFNARSFLHFQIEVGGHAPAASLYAGFSSKRAVWLTLVLSGMTAGIAGVGEIAGPVGQLNLNISPGYGFAAIIVAYLGRLHALGIVLAGFLMALIYLGGEAAQVALQLPAAITGIFQGMLLFFLLGSDVFIDNRLRRRLA
ncbi:ABC transporter permease [Propionivibrio dicarboxylicus]|uniref:Simple sugar transport system permease protein n=1 Tax=Propionivibrio dicarboxylicus TaxID=83767 RepID=A0A1G7XPV0_9RHOO|nr:ABC transporter permease [Propionivibrio dicarboxylicus]SDG86141.1 simple sugar transport system permease protein [Propionivibrio dicarboxylicus]